MDDSERESLIALDNVLNLEVSDCDVFVCVASYVANEKAPVFQRLQVSAELTTEFRAVVEKFLKQRRKENEEQQLVLWPHLDGTTPGRFNQFEHLDLDVHDQIRAQIEGLAVPAISLPVFTAADEVVSGIRFYVITIQPQTGTPVHFFRTYTPVTRTE